MEILLSNTKQTEDLAREIAKNITPNTVIALYGDLGAGKTTFTRYLCQALKITTRVQSPTFVIHRTYSGENKKIKNVNHIDLYRITDPSQIDDFGLEETFQEPNSITVIEWPEVVENILPANTVKIMFEYIDEDSRKAYVQNIN